MADKNIMCKDCGSEFYFTEDEMLFYKGKGFDNEPVRCPKCRRARKTTIRIQGGYIHNYKAILFE